MRASLSFSVAKTTRGPILGAENEPALCKPQSSRLTRLQNVTFSFSRATTLCHVIKSYLWMFTFNI